MTEKNTPLTYLQVLRIAWPVEYISIGLLAYLMLPGDSIIADSVVPTFRLMAVLALSLSWTLIVSGLAKRNLKGASPKKLRGIYLFILLLNHAAGVFAVLIGAGGRILDALILLVLFAITHLFSFPKKSKFDALETVDVPTGSV